MNAGLEMKWSDLKEIEECEELNKVFLKILLIIIIYHFIMTI